MASLTLASSRTISNSQCFRARQHSAPRPVARACRTAVVATSQEQPLVSRRDTVLSGLGAAALLLNVSPAQAFLGFGGPSGEEVYVQATGDIINKVSTTIGLPKDDPSKEERVLSLRKDINQWVAKYRRDTKFGGRASYGNTYSALNALAGHYNSFGPTAAIPKKRLDRIEKELADATKLLARGR